MALPTSGTYYLTVMGPLYYTGKNKSWQSEERGSKVKVTFGKGFIKLGYPFNTTITYKTNQTAESSVGADGKASAIVLDTKNNGAHYLISSEPITNKDVVKEISEQQNSWSFHGHVITKKQRNENGDTNIFDPPAICFLSGSQIMTSSGLRSVEELCVGDSIITYVNNEAVIDKLVWVGKAHCYVRDDMPDDHAGYPVRVKKDAIAQGIPFKDMLVTSEHCLFFDGYFIPARMLVNGSSIIFDKMITSYDYYHIETQTHSVIMADGMYTESYLDTGNRNSFSQDDVVFTLYNKTGKSWERDAAAPLCVSREIVEPIYHQIQDRANVNEQGDQLVKAELTTENGLCLITDTQQILYPLHVSGDKVTFVLPKSTQSVMINSNASRPYDTIGPFVDDRRKLGVLIGDILLFENTSPVSIEMHLQDEKLKGWCNLESGVSMRWTSGAAYLSLSDEGLKHKTLFVLQIIQSGPYLVEDVKQQIYQKIA